MARTGRALALVLSLALGCSDDSILPDPQLHAASLPPEADVAVGATHDVLVVACRDEVSLLDLIAPVAFAAIFVGLGRLDAAFYVPGAIVEAMVPSCKATSYSTSSAALDAPAFTLEPTANPDAFRAHARAEGTSVFSATVTKGAERLTVTSTLRAWSVNRVAFSPVCTAIPDGGQEVAAGYLPAGHRVTFTHRLFHDELELAGYGFEAVASDRIELGEPGRGTASVTIGLTPGEVVLSSPHDPSYAETITIYDATSIDALSIARTSGEPLLVGNETHVQSVATIGGRVPCVWGFPRTVTIETPGICALARSGGNPAHVMNGPVAIAGLAPGTCRVRVALEGTALTEVLELTVHRGFQEVPLGEELDLSESLIGLWVSGPGELVVVGYDEESAGRLDGLIIRHEDGAWVDTERLRGSGTLRAVHASPAGDTVGAAGNDGSVALFDGARWNVENVGSTETLRAILVRAPGDVWAAGEGTLAHFDGASWNRFLLDPAPSLTGLWDVDGEIWVSGAGVLARVAGDDLEPVPLTGLSGNAQDLHFAGVRGTAGDLWVWTRDAALHLDGERWTLHSFPELEAGDAITDVWPVGDGHAYVLARLDDRIALLRFDGTRFVQLLATAQYTGGSPRALRGWGDELIVLTSDLLLRYQHDAAEVFP